MKHELPHCSVWRRRLRPSVIANFNFLVSNRILVWLWSLTLLTAWYPFCTIADLPPPPGDDAAVTQQAPPPMKVPPPQQVPPPAQQAVPATKWVKILLGWLSKKCISFSQRIDKAFPCFVKTFLASIKLFLASFERMFHTALSLQSQALQTWMTRILTTFPNGIELK